MGGEAAQDMKIDPARAQALVSQLEAVRARIAAVAKGRPVRLVAVSKLHPANDILALHRPAAAASPQYQPHLHFGENYAQELKEKAELLPRSVRWHFIGGLQSGHCKALAKIPNLWCVSSVDSAKKASLLDGARGALLASLSSPESSSEQTAQAGDEKPGRLNVHVQVNTSGEASKSGCAPGPETVALCAHVLRACPNLRLLGLMTIGAIARSHAAASGEGENEDFAALVAQRDLVARELGLAPADLELSMGMSEDFEAAVAMGSGEVRVGSTIFGQRPAKADAKVAV